jgi:hypothetical protein
MALGTARECTQLLPTIVMSVSSEMACLTASVVWVEQTHDAKRLPTSPHQSVATRTVHTFASGDVYEGMFECDEFHGQGCYRSAQGPIYQGTFQRGRKVCLTSACGEQACSWY